MSVEHWKVCEHPKYGGWCLFQATACGGFRSIGFASKEEAEARYRKYEAIGRCRECGDVLHDDYIEETKARIHAEKMCFNCLFWSDYAKTASDPTHLVTKGEHYVIEPDKPKHYQGFVGHGGAEFTVRFFDGREVVSRNLWAQGRVPEHFRDRLPDNAEFVRRGHRTIGADAGYGGPGSADAAVNP